MLLISAEIMRTILFSTIAGMALLATFFLRQRALSLRAYLGWGLLAVLLPILGPYLVIVSRPGYQR